MKRLIHLLFILMLFSSLTASANAQFLSDISMKLDADAYGTSLLPVYSAPDESAYRGAEGRASVSLRESFQLLAATKDETWWLIEYDVSKNEKRVGWIRMAPDQPEPAGTSLHDWLMSDDTWLDESEVPDDDADMTPVTLMFSEPARITRQTVLTDDPRGGKRALRELQAGEFLGTFFEEDFDADEAWMYVITMVDGKKACGFVPRDCVEAVCPVHMEGSTLVYEEGIEFIGECSDQMEDDAIEYRDNGPVFAKARFGMVHSPLPVAQYRDDAKELFGVRDMREIKSVQLPSTLRLIGDDALYLMTLNELVIPEGTEYIRGLSAFYSMQIGTLYLPSTLRDFGYCSMWSGIKNIVVSDSNPYIKSVDGVVYTKDGKTLLSYPNGRDAYHYDVLKGTETIYDYAFYAYPYYDWTEPLALKTLSLPIGLRRIGAYAFDGLEELISLTIPPTVVEIGPYAFGEMASLTQLSLPESLRDAVNEYIFEDLETRKHNGDNGNLVERR